MNTLDHLTENVEHKRTLKFKCFLDDGLTSVFKTGCRVEKELWNSSLKYLEANYGYKKLNVKYPSNTTDKQYLINTLKSNYLKNNCNGLERWNYKETGLQSQFANNFLMLLVTNFGEYRKELYVSSKWSKEHKKKYHKEKGHSWYTRGKLRFKRKDDTVNTMIFNNNGKYQIEIMSAHWLNIPGFGKIQVKENIYNLKKENDDLKIAKIKKIVNLRTGKHFYQLQLCYVKSKKRKEVKEDQAVGLDWGMKDFKVFHASNDNRYHVADYVVNKVNNYLDKISLIQKKYEYTVIENGKEVKKHRRINRVDKHKIQKLYAKRSNLLTEFYKYLAILLFNSYDLLCVEHLTAKDMRKEKHVEKNDLQNKLKKGFNKKLALIKPYELMSILTQRANKLGLTIIKVDSYKTSQVEYGTDYVKKHELNEWEWISEKTGKKIDRDLNASKNILDWALHPNKHFKIKELKEKEKKMKKEKKEKQKSIKIPTPLSLVVMN